MGGLRKHMPVTFWTFIIGTAALIGFVPFAGFWSKDDIIAIAFREGNWLVFGAGALTAVLTAFYMTRATILTFFGEYRGHAHPHESPRIMTIPLVVLAIPSILIGFLGAPQLNLGIVNFNGAFGDWVFSVRPEIEPFSFPFLVFSLVAVVLGFYGAYRLYAPYRERDPLVSLGPVHTALENRLYVDDFYLRGIVRPVQYSLSAAVAWGDKNVIDALVNGVALLTRGLAQVVTVLDNRVIDGAVNEVGEAAGETGGLLRYLQSGNVQRYMVFLFVGIVALAVIFTSVT
jgi:NADH-quinone oxidoreductase subunit L